MLTKSQSYTQHCLFFNEEKQNIILSIILLDLSKESSMSKQFSFCNKQHELQKTLLYNIGTFPTSTQYIGNIPSNDPHLQLNEFLVQKKGAYAVNKIKWRSFGL